MDEKQHNQKLKRKSTGRFGFDTCDSKIHGSLTPHTNLINLKQKKKIS